MFSRKGLVTLWLLLACGGIGNAQSSLYEGCSVQAFETRPEAAVEACTAILDAGGVPDRARAEALKIRARSLHTIGHLDEAIGDYEVALPLAPDDPELHLRRGWTAYDKLDFDLVRRQAEQALKLKPGYADANDLIGSVLAHPSVRRFDEARAAYNETIRADPGNPVFRYQLLEHWVSTPGALEVADTLLQLPAPSITKPNAIEYYRKRTSFRTAVTLERGKMLATLGKFDDARATFDRAVQDDPGALSYAWRAAFLLERSALPTPMNHGQPCLEPPLPDGGDVRQLVAAHLSRALFFIETYELKRALSEADAALGLDQASVEARHLVARLAMSTGDLARAEREILIAIKESPDDMNLRATDAIRLQLQPARREALHEFYDILSRHPDHAFSREARAKLLLSMRRFKEAVADLDVLLADDNSKAILWSFRAMAYLGMNEPRRAVADFNKAMDDHPGQFDLLTGRASAYELAGDGEAALRDFDTILGPIDGTPNYALGGDQLAKYRTRRASFWSALTALQMRRPKW